MTRKTTDAKPHRTCASCIHEYACGMWTYGNLHNTNADNCVNYETIYDAVRGFDLSGLLKESDAAFARRMGTSEKMVLLSEIIGVFESFLDEKGVYIANPDRDDNAHNDPFNIYGVDYGNVSDAIEQVLKEWKIIPSKKGE